MYTSNLIRMIQASIWPILLFISSNTIAQESNIFSDIQKEIKEFNANTSSPPDDRLTKKIRLLRDLKGGFNIEEAIRFKLEEEKSKTAQLPDSVSKGADYITIGKGSMLLENAVIWIYRTEFSIQELNQLIRFYRTAGGKKLAARFPFIMLKSMAAAEIIMKSR